jgi:hypothetical protein
MPHGTQELCARGVPSSRSSEVLTSTRRQDSQSPVIVKRTILPLWVIRRWKRHENVFEGYYRTPYGSFEGKIVRRHKGSFDYFLTDPPECLWAHPHGRCFIHVAGNTYRVHFQTQGDHVDAGILAIEHTLAEAHETAN